MSELFFMVNNHEHSISQTLSAYYSNEKIIFALANSTEVSTVHIHIHQPNAAVDYNVLIN